MKPCSQSVRNDARSWVALLLVLVTSVFAFAQAVHMHRGLADDSLPNGTTTHCMLCVASHAAAVTAEVSFAPVLTYQSIPVLVAEPQLESRLLVFTSFTRPPPAV